MSLVSNFSRKGGVALPQKLNLPERRILRAFVDERGKKLVKGGLTESKEDREA
jgi:hypothetical protein